MNIVVRKGTAADLPAIRQLLEEEERSGVHGNFLCNWSVIERSAAKTLYVATSEGAVVGFQVGALVGPGILQVKNEWRRKGVGRSLVDYLVKRNVRRQNWLLHIECKPTTSIPFWKEMGFTIDTCGKLNGYRTLTTKFRVPKGTLTDVTITFYPEDIKWDATTQPVAVHSLQGSEIGRVVYLPRPVACAEASVPNGRDLYVKIEVAGRVISAAKCKYPESIRAGVLRCDGGYWLKAINLN